MKTDKDICRESFGAAKRRVRGRDVPMEARMEKYSRQGYGGKPATKVTKVN